MANDEYSILLLLLEFFLYNVEVLERNLRLLCNECLLIGVSTSPKHLGMMAGIFFLSFDLQFCPLLCVFYYP